MSKSPEGGLSDPQGPRAREALRVRPESPKAQRGAEKSEHQVDTWKFSICKVWGMV